MVVQVGAEVLLAARGRPRRRAGVQHRCSVQLPVLVLALHLEQVVLVVVRQGQRGRLVGPAAESPIIRHHHVIGLGRRF